MSDVAASCAPALGVDHKAAPAAAQRPARLPWREIFVLLAVLIVVHHRDWAGAYHESNGQLIVSAALGAGGMLFYFTSGQFAGRFQDGITVLPALCAAAFRLWDVTVVVPDRVGVGRLMLSWMLVAAANGLQLQASGRHNRLLPVLFALGHLALIPSISAPEEVSPAAKAGGLALALAAGTGIPWVMPRVAAAVAARRRRGRRAEAVPSSMSTSYAAAKSRSEKFNDALGGNENLSRNEKFDETHPSASGDLPGDGKAGMDEDVSATKALAQKQAELDQCRSHLDEVRDLP